MATTAMAVVMGRVQGRRRAAVLCVGGRRWGSGRAAPAKLRLRQCPPSHETAHATEVTHNKSGGAWSLLLTCEHASNALPALSGAAGAQQAATPPPPPPLLASHWGWDPGARALTLALLSRLAARPPPTTEGEGEREREGEGRHRGGLAAVLGGYSRLLLDANRPPGSDTMFRKECDGHAVALNAKLAEEAAAGRLAQLHTPFHSACAAEAERAPPRAVLSVHSFTDCYEGSRRDVEVGVLVDREQELGATLASRLCDAGWDARVNEPWSAAQGLMYCAERVAAPYASHALMLEVRQDLFERPAFTDQLADLLAATFAEPPLRPYFVV